MKTLPSLIALTGLAIGAPEDLKITEVVPSTGEVEVTNFGPDYTTTSNLPFCHRFLYGSAGQIAAGTTFASGESLIFTIQLSNENDSDLWLYKGGSFSDADNIISGLKWGPADNVGRENLASSNGKWDGTLLDAVPAGMSLQYTGHDFFKGASWSPARPSLGVYPDPASMTVVPSGAGATISWVGGTTPFRVQRNTTLNANNWENIGPVLETRSHSLATLAEAEAEFFRIASAAVEPTANFRVTFTSLWGRDRFATVPFNEHFSPLIGGTHNDSIRLWQNGGTATLGIERMAETGSTNSFITVEFTASRTHPLLSLVSMIAPSPDWFVGTDSQSLLDENGEWIESLTVPLVSYDSGTDSGTTFTSSDSDNNEPIFRIPADDPNFLPVSGTPVGDPIPIASFLIEKIN